MKLSKIIAGATMLAAGTLVLANHISIPLSSVFGGDVLTSIKYYSADARIGVPAYVIGGEIADVGSDDHGGFPLAQGDSFSISNGTMTDVIVFSESDFEAIDDATQEEIVAAINAQTDLVQARVDNGHIVMEGAAGGSGAELTLGDVTNVPLSILDIDSGTVTGEDDIRLTISIPADDEHEHPGDNHLGDSFAHHTYVVVASTTDDEMEVDGVHVPVGLDSTVQDTLRATNAGLLPGFIGELDDNGDAMAVFETDLLPRMFPGELPAELYFAFVVLSEDGDHVVFASNRFTVEIE